MWDEGENSLEDGTVIGALSVGETDAIRARTQTLRDVGATRSKFHGLLRDVCFCTIVCIILGCRPAAGVAELCVFNLRSAFVCFTRQGTLHAYQLAPLSSNWTQECSNKHRAYDVLHTGIRIPWQRVSDYCFPHFLFQCVVSFAISQTRVAGFMLLDRFILH